MYAALMGAAEEEDLLEDTRSSLNSPLISPVR